MSGAPGRLTLLLVDDDADFRRTTALLIQDFGHRVFEAGNARDAMSVLKTLMIDVLIADIGLHGQQGHVFAAEARGVQPSIRLVFVTGDGGFPDPEDDAHGPFLLRKPVNIADLETAIARAR